MGISEVRRDEYRTRAQRMLRSEFKSEDFNKVLLHIRQCGGGYGVLRDVGDFVAHAAERDNDKSEAVALARGIHANFRWSNFVGKSRGDINLQSLPAFGLSAAKYKLAKTSKNNVRSQFDTSKHEAEKQLLRIEGKFEKGADGNLRVFTALTDAELKFLEKCLSGSIVIARAYTQDKFVNEMFSALVKEQILEAGDEAAFRLIGDRMAAEVLTILHTSQIKLEDGVVAMLRAHSGGSGPDGFLGVNFEFPPIFMDAPHIRMSTPMFVTTLRASSWCNSSLALDPQAHWELPLEVGADGKLAPLQ